MKLLMLLIYNEENIETIWTQAIDITNIDVSINCILQGLKLYHIFYELICSKHFYLEE